MANPTQFDTWLQRFPREEVEGHIRDLERELSRWRHALALHDSFGGAANGASPETPDPDTPPNRPAAIRRVIREGGNQPMAAGEIKDALIERGWLESDRRTLKRFYSAMSTMTKRGHLLRLHDSRYMLPQEALGGDAMS